MCVMSAAAALIELYWLITDGLRWFWSVRYAQMQLFFCFRVSIPLWQKPHIRDIAVCIVRVLWTPCPLSPKEILSRCVIWAVATRVLAAPLRHQDDLLWGVALQTQCLSLLAAHVLQEMNTWRHFKHTYLLILQYSPSSCCPCMLITPRHDLGNRSLLDSEYDLDFIAGLVYSDRAHPSSYCVASVTARGVNLIHDQAAVLSQLLIIKTSVLLDCSLICVFYLLRESSFEVPCFWSGLFEGAYLPAAWPNTRSLTLTYAFLLGLVFGTSAIQ
jgi:hypothetical protein